MGESLPSLDEVCAALKNNNSVVVRKNEESGPGSEHASCCALCVLMPRCPVSNYYRRFEDLQFSLYGG